MTRDSDGTDERVVNHEFNIDRGGRKIDSWTEIGVWNLSRDGTVLTVLWPSHARTKMREQRGIDDGKIGFGYQQK